MPGTMEHSATEAAQDKIDSYTVLTFNGSVPEKYQPFILSSWLQSLRYGNDFFKLIDPDAYFRTYSKVIQILFQRKNIVLKMAVLTEDDDNYLGFSISEGNTLHYTYVPRDYRKHGIATSLIPENIQNITHLTTIGMSIWSKKYSSAKFNPFL